MAANPLSPEVIQMALQVGDPNGITPLEANMTEKLMLISVANMKCSLALADPSLYDCPLIGCSDGFEDLTGYSKAEIVGRNCRFLNRDQDVDPDVREAMRCAIKNGTEFIGILPNVRKNGEKFRNFLHMTTIAVRDHKYIIGIQADVTYANFDLTEDYHLEDLRAVAERIFSANIDAWVQMQAHEFQVRLPIPYAEIVKNYAPAQYKEAQGKFIKIAGQLVHNKNTFLHVMEAQVGEYAESKIKKSASDPLLLNGPATGSRSATDEMHSSEVHSSEKEYPSQSDSCEHASGDNSGSRGSSSDEACQNYRGDLKSVGSVGHPDRCTECSFYFFGTHGCAKGSDCRFCHEFHPRKNSRKNRRILKRLDASRSDESIPEENTGESSTTAPSDPAPSLGENRDASFGFNPETRSTQGSSSNASTHSKASAAIVTTAKSIARRTKTLETEASMLEPDSGTSAVISVRYLRHGNEKRQAKLTLAVGQEVHLPAWVEMDSSARKALKNVLNFSVDPPLPRGLRLDPQNGLISGAATEVQARRLHMVTVSTLATGPSGIRLGLVPLARTSLLIRIVELTDLKASWVCEADGDGDERILVEFKAPTGR